MNSVLSVIICTYNPRRDYLERVLQALKEQTLSKELWELLLIDNASNELLSSEIDLLWHKNARHIREEQLGLTHARIRGINEAATEIIVFVDDDNVLDSSYLEVAWRISKDWPMLGAWGGQVIPEFEKTPPDRIKPYLWMLALRELERDMWSNLPLSYETAPVGAGMCIRKVVAKKYAEIVSNNQKRANLDVKGKQLLRGGDMDLAFTSCDVGLGTGLFVSLKLTHLIPASRTQDEYLLRLAQGIKYSDTILEYCRGKMPTQPKFSWIRPVLKYLYYHLILRDSISWRFSKAFATGRSLAIQETVNT